jgi:iron complex transport system ATP-binding protein
MRQRSLAALETVGVAHLANRFLDELSSGEARRVMLARVLVTEPRALVLDEPTTGLDIAARHAFMERVRDIARSGRTIILITHHLEEIVPEIERVVLLRAGRIVGDGPKSRMLAPEPLSHVFDLPVAIERADGYHYARPQV